MTTVKASVKAGFRVIQYGAYAKMMAMVKITVNRELKQRQRRRRRERQKKPIGLDWQNNNFARATRFFVHFLAVVTRQQFSFS